MIDPVSVLIAIALTGGGWLLGRHARLKSTPQPIRPICFCGDHYGTHDPETGECRAMNLESRHSSTKGSWEEWLACACVRYTGPQPVEQYWVPPAADMSIVTAPRQVERGER